MLILIALTASLLVAVGYLWWMMASALAILTGLPWLVTFLAVVGLSSRFSVNGVSYSMVTPRYSRWVSLLLAAQCLWWTAYVEHSVWQSVFVILFGFATIRAMMLKHLLAKQLMPRLASHGKDHK